MCGFIALAEPGRIFSPELLADLQNDLLHRGPDSGGVLAEPGVGLTFRRLAILDPSEKSDQPMTDPSGRYSLVFNGEIYNFRRLRAELQDAGIEFRTTGDTEVILAGYAHWGEAVFERLEGMFAAVIVDRAARRLVAARDPFGIKPLYFLKTDRLAAFASEMRPFARLTPLAPDPAALAELLVFRYAAGRLSNLSSVDSVPGGTVVTVALDDLAVTERRFCDPLDTLAPDAAIDAETAAEQARAAITRSLHDHLASDVGYTVQLSGGVDSSLVSALAAAETNGRLVSFGVHIPNYEADEAPYRDLAVERIGLDHHEVTLDGVAFADALPRAVRHMEGPVPHYGCVMLMLLCDRIRSTSKVVLTGEGADEMFGGYKRYGIWRDLRTKGRLARLVPGWAWPVLQRWREIQKYRGRDPAIYGAVYHDFLSLNDMFPDLVPAPGFRESAAARFADFRARMFAVDQSAYLGSLLMRQDKMSMAASVEARVPFTHMPLASVVNRFPNDVRAPGGETKLLLKRIAETYLPRELIYRRKIGLALPLDEWLADTASLGRYLELLTEPGARLATYTQPRRLREAVEAFRAGKRTDLPPLAHLINMELWLRSLPAAQN